MKKTIFLIVLLLAVPAMAAVNLTCSVAKTGGGNGTLTISYDASSETELVRAFALDVVATGATISSVGSTNDDYWVYPGTIVIDTANQAVNQPGSPVAPAGDPGAKGPLGTSAVTIEMGSLYTTGGPNSVDQLIVLNLTSMVGIGTVAVDAEPIRGNIVLEDSTSVDSNTTCSWLTGFYCDTCTYWSQGDYNGDGWVNGNDIIVISNQFGANTIGSTDPNIVCHDGGAGGAPDGWLNGNDLIAIANNFGAGDGTGCKY